MCNHEFDSCSALERAFHSFLDPQGPKQNWEQIDGYTKYAASSSRKNQLLVPFDACLRTNLLHNGQWLLASRERGIRGESFASRNITISTTWQLQFVLHLNQ